MNKYILLGSFLGVITSNIYASSTGEENIYHQIFTQIEQSAELVKSAAVNLERHLEHIEADNQNILKYQIKNAASDQDPFDIIDREYKRANVGREKIISSSLQALKDQLKNKGLYEVAKEFGLLEGYPFTLEYAISAKSPQ